jgi:acyl-CoA thioester hydrolase
VPPVWSSPVRFIECDQQGVVFNAHYLVWADEAVNSWWSEVGVDWPALIARGFEYFVVASSQQWQAPARYGDVVDVDAELTGIGRSSVTVRFVVRVGERQCCEVRTTYVCTRDGRSTPWPEEVRALLPAA